MRHFIFEPPSFFACTMPKYPLSQIWEKILILTQLGEIQKFIYGYYAKNIFGCGWQ